jgi:hypothetical protein
MPGALNPSKIIQYQVLLLAIRIREHTKPPPDQIELRSSKCGGGMARKVIYGQIAVHQVMQQTRPGARTRGELMSAFDPKQILG